MAHRRRRLRQGTVSGYVLKLARESIPYSQEALAALLAVDRATVQGWESGRRPFPAVPLGQTITIRQRLIRMGASRVLVGALDHAAEADLLISEVLELDPSGTDLGEYRLGWTVMTHPVTEMVAWASAGQTPQVVRRHRTAVARRGPVPPAPSLTAVEQVAFYRNLRVVAERSERDDEHILLHRQACYLAGLAPSGSTAAWLAPAKRLFAYFTRPHEWTPRWPDARSLATSLAKQGDPEPLRAFIARAHGSDTCELAGLNYWAYWVGEIDEVQLDDSFMVDPRIRWRGTRLLGHLVDRMDHRHAFVDLNVHTIWSLLAARRDLAHDDPALTRNLLVRSRCLLDGDGISDQSRRELTSLIYGLRMDGVTGGGRP